MQWTQQKIGEWNQEIGGADPTGLLKHAAEEIVELQQDAGTFQEMDEAADVVILLMAYAYLRGFDLLDAVDRKMERNVLREWNKPDSMGIVRHKK